MSKLFISVDPATQNLLVAGCPLCVVTHCAAASTAAPTGVGLKALIRNLCVTQIEIECQAKLWNIYHVLRQGFDWILETAAWRSRCRRRQRLSIRITNYDKVRMTYACTHTHTHTLACIFGMGFVYCAAERVRRHKLDLPASARSTLNRKNVKYL